MSRQRDNRPVWHIPVLLGLISAIGLVTALLSNEWGDLLSWLTLGAVCAAGVWISVLGFSPKRRG